MKQALAKVRSAPGRAWRGTARTARWAGSGVAAGPRRAARAVGGATRGARDRVRGSAEGVWRRSGGARVAQSARSSPRVAIAWAVGAVLVVAWIGWAIYVTTEYGGAAGLGVLISWPVAIAAVALVAAPFVGVYLLLQRIRGPALAGPAGLADAAHRSERTETAKDKDDTALEAGGEGGQPDAEGGGPDDAGDEPDDEDDDSEREDENGSDPARA